MNPCGDPPVGAGGVQQPTAEGGALRAQSLLRVAGLAVLSGAILRVDPNSGAGMPDNPLARSSDPNARRMVRCLQHPDEPQPSLSIARERGAALTGG